MFGNVVARSSTGYHQGDPLAGQLFATTQQPVVLMIEQEVPELEVNGWTHDDGTLVATKPQLQKAVDIILREGPPSGLYLSTSRTVRPGARVKSTVWSPTGSKSEDLDPLQRGIVRERDTGIILLGTSTLLTQQ